MHLYLLLGAFLSYIPFIAVAVLQNSPNTDILTQGLKLALPLNLSRPTGDSASAPSHNASKVARLPIECSAAGLGPDVSASNCMNAIERIGTDTTLRVYGQRFQGNFDVFLPYRIPSGK